MLTSVGGPTGEPSRRSSVPGNPVVGDIPQNPHREFVRDGLSHQSRPTVQETLYRRHLQDGSRRAVLQVSQCDHTPVTTRLRQFLRLDQHECVWREGGDSKERFLQRAFALVPRTGEPLAVQVLLGEPTALPNKTDALVLAEWHDFIPFAPAERRQLGITVSAVCIDRVSTGTSGGKCGLIIVPRCPVSPLRGGTSCWRRMRRGTWRSRALPAIFTTRSGGR